MGKVGDVSVFWVWGSRAFVRDTSADKLSARAIPCVFLGFPPDTPGWQFYHPTSRRVIPSQDVTFDESVPFYSLFPYRSAPPAPSPLFLALDPLPGTLPVEVAVGSGAARGAEPRCAEPGGVEPEGAEPEGVDPGGAKSEGAESGGAEPQGTASSGGPAGASRRLAGDTGAGGAGVTAGAGGTGGAAAAGPGGARTRGTGASGIGGVGGDGVGDPTEPGGAGAGGPGAGGTRMGGAGAGGAGAVDPGAGGAGGGGAGGTGAGGAMRPRPYFVPLLQQTGNLTEHRGPESRPPSPVRNGRRVPRPRPPPVRDTHAMALRPSSVPLRVPLPAPPESSLPAIPDPEFEGARTASPTVSRLLATIVTDPSFESTAASALVAELVHFAAACRLDYATALVAESESTSPPSVGDIPTPRSYAEAITGPYSSQWQAAMDAKMASWKSTGTYIDAVPPSGANIVDGMWIFRVKRPPGSPPALKARYVARGFSQRQGVDYFQTFSPTPKMTTLQVLLHVVAQRDYELHSLDFSTAFFLWRPVYGLRQAPREWHDTLRTTLVALGFTRSSADPSLFLRTDTWLPPFYVLVLQRFGFQFSSPQPTPLSTSHSLSAPPSDESVEPSCPYPELVGCLITLGMGLVLGGRGPVVLSGHETLLGSSCEAEIYVGAMAAQELCWLTYLLTGLGEQPHLPQVLNVDNKAMIALCQEHRLDHRTKHIALRYFLARELQQRGQLRLASVATRANTADIFTKALPPGDHQRFSTVLGPVPTLPHLLSA
ncbi:unnamed protein product [Closterium sp. NIES-53]